MQRMRRMNTELSLFDFFREDQFDPRYPCSIKHSYKMNYFTLNFPPNHVQG